MRCSWRVNDLDNNNSSSNKSNKIEAPRTARASSPSGLLCIRRGRLRQCLITILQERIRSTTRLTDIHSRTSRSHLSRTSRTLVNLKTPNQVGIMVNTTASSHCPPLDQIHRLCLMLTLNEITIKSRDGLLFLTSTQTPILTMHLPLLLVTTLHFRTHNQHQCSTAILLSSLMKRI